MKSDIERVSSLLRVKIRSEKIPAGSRLPGFRHLCKTLSITHYSLLKVFDELEKEGLIVREKKVGIFARGDRKASAYAPRILPRLAKDRQLATDLKNDISRGKFRVGEFFPASKFIRYQYQSSPQVVRKALCELEESGLLHRKGHGYVVGQEGPLRHAPGRKALVISDEPSIITIGLSGETVRSQLLRSLANTLYDLGLVMEPDNSQNENIREFPKNEQLGNAGGIVGLFSPKAFHQFDNELFHIFNRFLQRTNRLGLPVVIFRTGPYPAGFLKATRKYRKFFPISTAYSPSGVDVGKYAALKGHRSIAFFSFTNQEWDRQRNEDVKQGHKAILGKSSLINTYAANFDTRKFFREHTARKKGPYFSQFVEKEHNGFVFKSTKPFWKAKGYVLDLLWLDELRTVMSPLFEQALKWEACTAWICSDPGVALAAQAFLKQKGMGIPRNLSLISIDDLNELAIRGITAFSFQGERLGYLAAHCIAGDIPVKRKRNGLVDCPGRIIERGSVGRV